MPPKSKGPVLCKASIKDEQTLQVRVCGVRLEEFRCPNRVEHMMVYKTGFCSNGNCEGSARKSKSGASMPTCKWWKVCPCNCHKTFDMMFSASEMPRILVDNSGYVADHSAYSMPTPEERAAYAVSFTSDHADVPIVIKSPAPDVTPTTIAHVFGPTVTGRAARGELEAWVKEQCDIWLIDNETVPCTPPYLAREIAKHQGFVREPSVGAVDAVLKRWVTLGFAVMEIKPTRFVCYTDEGIRLGLEGLKDKFKRTKKMSQQASARGSLR